MSEIHTRPDLEDLPDDPEVPVEDALEQSVPADADEAGNEAVADSRRRSSVSDDIEVPVADAWEQSQPVAEHEEY